MIQDQDNRWIVDTEFIIHRSDFIVS